MPNRLLKESICTSDDIDALSWFEEVLYYRLIVNCDDYGRFDGRAAVIKNRLFPLKDNLTLANVMRAINKLASIGLVSLYEFEGKPFLFLPSWNEHQQIRAKKSKYPVPADTRVISSDITCNQMISNDIKRNQMISNVPVIQSNTNPIQYNESNTETESEYNTTTTTTDAPACAMPPSLIEIFLYFKNEHDLLQANDEASKFDAYNAARGWDCMPNWKAAADLWVIRMNERSI